MVNPPNKITRLFCSISHGISYLTLFDGVRYLGRLQIERDPDAPSWKRHDAVAPAEGEMSLESLRSTWFSGPEPLVWQDQLFFAIPDRLELRGTQGARRLVLVSPFSVPTPTPADEVDAFNYLLGLTACIGLR